MSSCTRTTRAERCSSDSTSFASRRIGKAASRAGRSPTSLRRRKPDCADHIGAFAVTSGIGLKELCDRFRAENDDYNAIMAEAIADRLAEAFAECLHKRVRDEWGYGCEEGLSNADLIQEKYRGNQAGRGLSGVPGPHGEGHALAVARCAGEHRNADYRVVCDVARLERERTLLRASGIAIFQPRQDRPRSGGRLSRAQGNERGGGRAVAGAKSELRSCEIASAPKLFYYCLSLSALAERSLMMSRGCCSPSPPKRLRIKSISGLPVSVGFCTARQSSMNAATTAQKAGRRSAGSIGERG